MSPLKVIKRLIKGAALAAMFCAAAAAVEPASPVKPALIDDGSQLAGNWMGESICVGIIRPAMTRKWCIASLRRLANPPA